MCIASHWCKVNASYPHHPHPRNNWTVYTSRQKQARCSFNNTMPSYQSTNYFDEIGESKFYLYNSYFSKTAFIWLWLLYFYVDRKVTNVLQDFSRVVYLITAVNAILVYIRNSQAMGNAQQINILVQFPISNTLIARFMGPTLGPPGADRTHVGSMLALWIMLSGCRSPVQKAQLCRTKRTAPWKCVGCFLHSVDAP